MVQPAARDLVTLRLRGAQLVRLLDEQWRPERTTRLQCPGLAYELDPTVPLGRRVARVRVGDRMLDPEASYSGALDAYLAADDGFAVPLEATQRSAGPKDLATLIDHVRALPQPFAAGIEGRVRHAPAVAGAL